jgi:ferric-dicitrate binding protein FerR (iron transport regulator)
MAGNGERLNDRLAVLSAEQSNDPRSTWTPSRPVRRALVAAYGLALAALATVGWIDARKGWAGMSQGRPYGTRYQDHGRR